MLWQDVLLYLRAFCLTAGHSFGSCFLQASGIISNSCLPHSMRYSVSKVRARQWSWAGRLGASGCDSVLSGSGTGMSSLGEKIRVCSSLPERAWLQASSLLEQNNEIPPFNLRHVYSTGHTRLAQGSCKGANSRTIQHDNSKMQLRDMSFTSQRCITEWAMLQPCLFKS